MAILSAFKIQVATSVPPNFMVFDDPTIALFFLTTVAITILFFGKIILARKVASFAPWTIGDFVKKRLFFIIFNLCECTFLAQASRGFMLKYKWGTLIVLLAATNLVIFYETYLNTNQVHFNAPHLVESYAQIEKETIKPVFLSAMNDLGIVLSVSDYNSESILKRVLKKYPENETVLMVSNEDSLDAAKRVMEVIKKLPAQRHVFIINDEILQLVKSMFCSFSLGVAAECPDLKLLSRTDPYAVDVNAQIPFKKDFLKTVPRGKALIQFVDQMYSVSQIAFKTYKKLRFLSAQQYLSQGDANRGERECASNNIPVPDPTVIPLQSVLPEMLNYVLATAILILVVEINWPSSFGLWLNNPKLKSHAKLARLVDMRRRIARRRFPY